MPTTSEPDPQRVGAVITIYHLDSVEVVTPSPGVTNVAVRLSNGATHVEFIGRIEDLYPQFIEADRALARLARPN